MLWLPSRMNRIQSVRPVRDPQERTAHPANEPPLCHPPGGKGFLHGAPLDRVDGWLTATTANASPWVTRPPGG